MALPRFDDLVIPAPPYRMARPVAVLATVTQEVASDPVGEDLSKQRLENQTPPPEALQLSPEQVLELGFESAQSNFRSTVVEHPQLLEDSIAAPMIAEGYAIIKRMRTEVPAAVAVPADVTDAETSATVTPEVVEPTAGEAVYTPSAIAVGELQRAEARKAELLKEGKTKEAAAWNQSIEKSKAFLAEEKAAFDAKQEAAKKAAAAVAPVVRTPDARETAEAFRGRISQAHSFEELFDAIRESPEPTIQGMRDGSMTREQQIALIEEVRSGKKSWEDVSRSWGISEKVKELLADQPEASSGPSAEALGQEVPIEAPAAEELMVEAEPEVGQFVEGKGWVTGYGEGDGAIYSETKPGETIAQTPSESAPIVEGASNGVTMASDGKAENAPRKLKTLEEERASVERAQGMSDEARARRLAEYDAAIAKRDENIAGTSQGQPLSSVAEGGPVSDVAAQPSVETTPAQSESASDFASAKSFEELASMLNAAGTIKNESGKEYSAEDMLRKITEARELGAEGGFAVDRITKAGGLREAVRRLLNEAGGSTESSEVPGESSQESPEAQPEPGSEPVNSRPTPEIEAARAAAERAEQEVRGGRMAAETDRRLRSEAERKIPSSAEVARLRAAKEHITVKPENRSWLQTMFDRVHAWQTRADIVERAHWQSRAQNKFEFAQGKISEFEKKLENAGPLSRMWYASRLKDWQSYSMKFEGKVARWSAEREALHERHAEYIRGVVERYDKVLTPYREQSKDLSERLSVQASVREKLVEHRKDALLELAKAEVAAKRGRWFKEPVAKKAMADIKEQLREIDRRIGDVDNKAQRYRSVLTDAELKIRSLEGKRAAVEEKLRYPEFGKLNIPAHEPLSSVAPAESAPAAPESDPSEAAWNTEDLIKQWNALGLQPIDDPASLIENVRDEVRRLNLRGEPKAKDLKAIVLKYLEVTTRQQKKVLEGDWKRFLEKAKPTQ